MSTFPQCILDHHRSIAAHINYTGMLKIDGALTLDSKANSVNRWGAITLLVSPALDAPATPALAEPAPPAPAAEPAPPTISVTKHWQAPPPGSSWRKKRKNGFCLNKCSFRPLRFGSFHASQQSAAAARSKPGQQVMY
jgi:hypothetical protein